MSDDAHVVEGEVEAWKTYKMQYDASVGDDIKYFDETCDTQTEVPGTHEFWECSCGATFTSGFDAADHLRERQESGDGPT